MNTKEAIEELEISMNGDYISSKEAIDVAIDALLKLPVLEAIISLGLGDRAASFAAIDVIKERQRQVEQEKFSAERDDKYFNEELSMAAACYALTDEARDCIVSVENLCLKQYEKGLLKEFIWPFKKEWWKPSPDNRRRELIKAAALLIAEIERLDRKCEAKK